MKETVTKTEKERDLVRDTNQKLETMGRARGSGEKERIRKGFQYRTMRFQCRAMKCDRKKGESGTGGDTSENIKERKRGVSRC